MNKKDKTAVDIAIDDFTAALLRALGGRQKTGINSFFASQVWFFLALFAVFVNIVMAAVIFWQRMKIDYLITKIIGE